MKLFLGNFYRHLAIFSGHTVHNLHWVLVEGEGYARMFITKRVAEHWEGDKLPIVSLRHLTQELLQPHLYLTLLHENCILYWSPSKIAWWVENSAQTLARVFGLFTFFCSLWLSLGWWSKLLRQLSYSATPILEISELQKVCSPHFRIFNKLVDVKENLV